MQYLGVGHTSEDGNRPLTSARRQVWLFPSCAGPAPALMLQRRRAQHLVLGLDPRERYYAPNTIKKSGTLRLAEGHALYSDLRGQARPPDVERHSTRKEVAAEAFMRGGDGIAADGNRNGRSFVPPVKPAGSVGLPGWPGTAIARGTHRFV